MIKNIILNIYVKYHNEDKHRNMENKMQDSIWKIQHKYKNLKTNKLFYEI
jgi:hypothetical protein